MSAVALAGVGALLAATACSSGAAVSASPPGAAGKPAVLAAFYPLQWMTDLVGGPDVAVTALTRPGVEPHDLELTPRQIADIERADLVVYVKGVQPALDEAVEQHAADRAFDVASAVPTIPAAGEDAHAEEAAAEHEEHEEVGYDPHVWLDPSRLASAVAKLGERLGQADSARAAAFTQRATTTAAQLRALDGEFESGLADCSSRTIVTSHAAFGYLADRYKLKQVGISGIDPEAEPSPARLAEVARVARQERVTTIFTEELVNPKVAEVLATEVGAKTAVLNPLESRPQTGDYLSASRANLSALRTALGCR
ncbi:metal ABC transporter substrate-binding protein [Sphaerisporangium sp. TRM90804]|uniref:metal ABC transporter substrate-binding protein n=1 Tax=Sphaerisporangium sp. TRM90804 TaxID=3031113 RepID=UPI00244C354D|nr:metal ABC transporter substrate-binding protein [Sphaerisporangium sp. TRM90804]MDH2425020.1 metal ABC transporter substrate-binding protein [Sphaerisporangium sp. TRM90804]